MLSLAKFIKKEIELRENLVGTGFLDPPPLVKEQDPDTDEIKMSGDYRCTVLGEIVETVGFQADNTYIFYDTFIPEGWAFEEANEQEIFGQLRDDHAEYNKRKSVTHISKASVELVDDKDHVEGTQYASHFSFPLDFQFLVQTSKLAERPYLLLQVNSIDSWGRHRVEGYGFVRFPAEPGYHQIEVETWRPRGSLQSEIHSFFLGGSIRIHKLEELIRTKFIDEQGMADVVNRFGLETENSGKIRVNLNMCLQNAVWRKMDRKKTEMNKEALLLETKKQVIRYKLKIKEQLEQSNKQQLLNQRVDRQAQRKEDQQYARQQNNNYDRGYGDEEQSYDHASEDDAYFDRNRLNQDGQQLSGRSRRGQLNHRQDSGGYDVRDQGATQMQSNFGRINRFQH